MPKYLASEPSRERRHTYKFSQDEVIAALEASIEGSMPQGKRHLWGLEKTKLDDDECLTLVIDELISELANRV